MKVNAMRNRLDSSELVFVIQKVIDAMTQRLKVALPRGWRLIVEVDCKGNKGTPLQELMYLDVQADEGGGSWAQAKIQTLKNFPTWNATHPMKIEEICNALRSLGFGDCDGAKIIGGYNLYAELTPDDIEWLVDVEGCPGLAPGFGGIKIPYRCNFVKKGLKKVADGSSGVLVEDRSQREMVEEFGEVLIAFSGGAQWQDLQFAMRIAHEMRNHWNAKKDEFLVMDFSSLKEYPEIEFWMANYGLC